MFNNVSFSLVYRSHTNFSVIPSILPEEPLWTYLSGTQSPSETMLCDILSHLKCHLPLVNKIWIKFICCYPQGCYVNLERWKYRPLTITDSDLYV